MRVLRSWLGLLGTLVLAGLSAPAGAQAVGSEFQVNTYTTFNQLTQHAGGHLVAMDASGKFVVVWVSHGQDGDSGGVFAQRHDSTGGRLGSEFRVNSYTTAGQDFPSVAAAADGDFVVVWHGSNSDVNSLDIFGQRYDSAGTALGTEFRVNSYTTADQVAPSIASDASGNFVVVWSRLSPGGSYGIFGQRYDSEGGARGGEFLVNSYTASGQVHPSVASDASGDFVIVWSNSDQDGDYSGIFGQRYDSAGVAQGDEFQVNTYTTSSQSRPSIASDARGNFFVTWQSYSQDGSNYGIFGQRYDSDGIVLGGEFRVNSYTTAGQLEPTVAADASGNFVVVWDGNGEHYTNIFSQRYDSAGMPQGAEFRVNSSPGGLYASVGATGTSQFVVAWTSSGQDGSYFGVSGQRFDFSGTPVITVTRPNTNVRWRIGSQHRIQWTHNLGGGHTFRIELDRDDDGVYEELIAAHADVDSDTRGGFAWTVTGPPSATARVRVSWTDDLSVSDSSDVTFQIRPVP